MVGESITAADITDELSAGGRRGPTEATIGEDLNTVMEVRQRFQAAA